ncbi:uncharacterized protein [Penaeus vannamei]|uniref:uncharacterized protein n=1 Tax=Penaeus vannamei TaxID=6689 RepID=UPI00387FAF28
MVSGRDPGSESGRWAASRSRDCEWWAARAWAASRGLRLLVAMAVNVLMPLLIPLGEQITNVTQLAGVGNLAFAHPRVEVFVKENAAPVFLLSLHAASNTTGKQFLSLYRPRKHKKEDSHNATLCLFSFCQELEGDAPEGALTPSVLACSSPPVSR